MRKLIIPFFLLFSIAIVTQSSAQKVVKKKAESTQKCKPTKSGKHCSKPAN